MKRERAVRSTVGMASLGRDGILREGESLEVP